MKMHDARKAARGPYNPYKKKSAFYPYFMKKFLLSLGLIAASGFYMLFAGKGSASGTSVIAQNAAATSSGVAQSGAAQSSGASAPPPSGSGGTSGSSGGTTGQTSSGNAASASAAASAPAQQPTGQYKNGTYTGSQVDAYYGIVQVAAVVSGGKLTNVKILQYPTAHSTSVYINQQALPYLIQEALSAQSANVNIISGATFTSEGFQQSLASALTQAKA
jgi:uncharacterized protein with FMN-binding domain